MHQGGKRDFSLHGQRKWPIPALVRKIMALGRKVFY